MVRLVVAFSGGLGYTRKKQREEGRSMSSEKIRLTAMTTTGG